MPPGATGYSPLKMCTSVPQIVVRVTRSRASRGTNHLERDARRVRCDPCPETPPLSFAALVPRHPYGPNPMANQAPSRARRVRTAGEAGPNATVANSKRRQLTADPYRQAAVVDRDLATLRAHEARGDDE